jgi:putative chitinase
MPLTGAMLKSIAGAVPGGASGKQVASWDALAKDCNDACVLLGFTTYKGYATFIANNCQESGYFRTTEEYAKNGPYAPYIGRTFIQVTWKTNYAAFGKYAVSKKLEGLTDPNYFVNNPKRLADVKWAWWGPCWYFSKSWGGKTLVQIADTSKMPNVAVAKAINMGSPTSPHTPSGMRTRDALYDKACSYGDKLMPVRSPAPAPSSSGILGMTHLDKFAFTGA